MRVVVGFGNDLRGEDGFGVDVVKLIDEQDDTKIISAFQLTPELALELKDYEEIVFVDAAHSDTNHYALACNLEFKSQNNLSHHISIEMIMGILNTIYGVFPKYTVFSMLTNSYDLILDPKKYEQNIKETLKHIRNS